MVATWKKLAFSEEVAALSNADPANVGVTAAEGVAVDASRSDHVHRLANGAVDIAAILANDVVGSEHIEALSADLDFAKNEATGMALDNQAAPPATPVLGQIYFHTGAGELHPYICTEVAA
jgi:hypothetical protein